MANEKPGLHRWERTYYTLACTPTGPESDPPQRRASARKRISMRFLVSICNQRAEPVRLPGTYLFEIDGDSYTLTPAPLCDARLEACVGITGLARYGDDLLAMVQSLDEPCMLVRFTTDYQ